MNLKDWLFNWAQAQATDCSLDLETLELMVKEAWDKAYTRGFHDGAQDQRSRDQNARYRQDMGQ